ncbi:MAG: lipid II flippase MurJ [Polyangiaceae bacterium]
MTPERARPAAAGPPSLARTALALLPLQAAFRGGEALLPLLLAAWFGRSSGTDLYYLLAAYFVFVGAVVTGVFQDSGAVAVLIEVEAAGPGAFRDVAGSLMGFTLAASVVLALVMGSGAAAVAWFVCPERMLAIELVALMSMGMVAVSVRAFYVGVLNALGAFSAHPLASGFGMALTWALLYSTRGAFGVCSIPLSMGMGESLAIALLAALAQRRLGLRIVPNLKRGEPIRRIFALTRLEVAGSLITRVNPLIDQLMAGIAGVVGGGTLVQYAGEVASLPTSVLQATLFPVLLRRLALEARHVEQFRATTRRTVFAVVVSLALLSGVLVAFRTPLCRLLFLRGAMDLAGVARIASILPWALAGAAPFGALLVLARAHVARQNSRIMPSMGILNATLNVVFNALLVGPLGLSGIALSTSLTYVVIAVVFWARLPRESA